MDGVSSRLRHRRASLPVLPSLPPDFKTYTGKGTLRSRIIKFLSKPKGDTVKQKSDKGIPNVGFLTMNSMKSSSLSNIKYTDNGIPNSDFGDTVFDSEWENEHTYVPLRSNPHRMSVRSVFSGIRIPQIKIDSNKYHEFGRKSRRPSLPTNSLNRLNVGRAAVVKSKSSDDILTDFSDTDNPKCKITVNVLLPSGFHREVTVEHDLSVRNIIEEATMETNLESYRVLMASTRAILDLQAEAHLLGNFSDIMVEEEVFDETDNQDSRLRITKDLYRTEKYYQDDVRSIFDVYAEPLRKFSSLTKEDHHSLFVGIEPILSLSAMVCRKLEDCITLWDPGSTKIGSLFSKQFWFHYNEYCCKFGAIRELLKDKRENDQEFTQFCQLRQGAAKYSLEALLLKPYIRISECTIREVLGPLITGGANIFLDFVGKYNMAVVSRMEKVLGLY